MRRHIQHMQRSALQIQSWYRMCHVRRQYAQQVRSVKLVQNWYKAHLDGRKERTRYCEMREAALTIQTAIRGENILSEIITM